jgi:hypothetical protein
MARDGRRQADRSSRPMLVVGALTAATGVVGIGVVAYWYGTDMGWTGSGALLVDSREQARAAGLMPVAAVLVGLVTLLVRRHVPLRSLAGVVVLVTSLLVAAGVAVAVAAYPQVQPAEVIAHGAGGWSTELPVTEVWGVRAETDSTITLEGRADRRSCDWEPRSVTLELSTGSILAVEPLPMSYGGASDVPSAPEPVDPERFEVRQGSSPFICRS